MLNLKLHNTILHFVRIRSGIQAWDIRNILYSLLLKATEVFQRLTYQEHVVKDLRRTVHLAQNDNHLIVDELLELSQIACHVHFQLCSDLKNTSRTERDTCRQNVKSHNNDYK